jgi:hypothetical protein
MLTQLEILPSKQIREVRDYPVRFPEMKKKPGRYRRTAASISRMVVTTRSGSSIWT